MHDERDSKSVDEPGGAPPDQGLTYDPAMTEGDEANIPPDSDAEPNTDSDEEPA